MPNIATMLKSEITRLARKEVRAEVATLQKTSGVYRAEIAALKRRCVALERQLNASARAAARESRTAGGAAQDVASADAGKGRFSAKSMRSQRARLGLSAAEIGVLVGSSSQSVYNWEEGKSRPQARHLEAIFALRGLGRRDARKILDQRAAAA